jgi:hypothetical protein
MQGEGCGLTITRCAIARGDATQSLSERQLLAPELKAMAAAGVLKLRYGQVQIESLTKLKAM